MRYFFRVEYDGTRYSGWQRQNNAPTIQEALERAFCTVLRASCRIVGAGRTDAGVHARSQGAHIETERSIDPSAVELSVNALLPVDIAVYRLQAVEESFHARYSVVSRRYRYFLCSRKRPLLFKRVWMVFYPIDWNKVESSAQLLCGNHDFNTFCAAGSGVRHARCTVTHASLTTENDLKVFTIEANRFVYTMVRSIMGTLIDIGRGHITDSMTDLLAAKDHRRAGITAPACGLVLDKVFYEGVD
jgi:tRNA pseudouridine38-40 synthase